MTVAEIIYFGRTAFGVHECWKDYELSIDGAKQPALKAQFKLTPNGQRIKLTQPTKLTKIEFKFLSSYGGPNPGASEIEVYGESVADSQLSKFNWSGGGQDAAIEPIKESPELLAKLKAGGLGFEKVAVIQRQFINCTHVYTYHTEGFGAGGAMYVCDVRDGKLTKLVDADKGQILDCDVSCDGRQILFSWRKEEARDIRCSSSTPMVRA